VRGSRRPQAVRLAEGERARGVLEAVPAERRPDPETDRSVADPGREGDLADDMEGDGPASPSGAPDGHPDDGADVGTGGAHGDGTQGDLAVTSRIGPRDGGEQEGAAGDAAPIPCTLTPLTSTDCPNPRLMRLIWGLCSSWATTERSGMPRPEP